MFTWTNVCALEEVSAWVKCVASRAIAKEMLAFSHWLCAVMFRLKLSLLDKTPITDPTKLMVR